MKSWRTVDGEVTEGNLGTILTRILEGHGTIAELGDAPGCADFRMRQMDRALQLLKRQGKIRFDHHARRWVALGEVR